MNHLYESVRNKQGGGDVVYKLLVRNGDVDFVDVAKQQYSGQ
jgi:hypothetical protein